MMKSAASRCARRTIWQHGSCVAYRAHICEMHVAHESRSVGWVPINSRGTKNTSAHKGLHSKSSYSHQDDTRDASLTLTRSLHAQSRSRCSQRLVTRWSHTQHGCRPQDSRRPLRPKCATSNDGGLTPTPCRPQRLIFEASSLHPRSPLSRLHARGLTRPDQDTVPFRCCLTHRKRI